MGIRSILRRAVKPAAMAIVAGTLALSLTVTTTQKAEASPIAVAPVILAAESIVGGASIPLAMPSLLAASIALHPVGWAIGAGVAVAGLALGAYHTRDYWLPYVNGDWGKAKGASPSSDPVSGTRVHAGLSYSSVQQVNSNVWQINGVMPAVNSATWAGNTARLSCKNRTTGNITMRNFNSKWSMSVGAAGRATMMQVYCGQTDTGGTATNEDIVGGVYGSFGADPVLQGSCYAAGNTTPACYWAGPSNVFKWGDQLGTATPAFDPKGADAKYKTTVECISDDGTKSTITADWTGDQGGAKFPSCVAAGKGHGTGKNKIEGYAPTAPGAAPAPAETLWETTAPAVDPNYEKCDQGRPGSGCKMAITIDGKPCVVGQWECENWTELYRDDATKPRVGCTYGPYTLSPDACSIMEPAYRPGGAPATEANVDGNPQTRNNNELNGEPYKPQQAPAAPGGAGTLPAGSTPEQGQCFPSGWSALNPVEWVMKPVGCALDAAFKPKKDLQQRVNAMGTQFSNKVPMSWFSTETAGVSGGSCPTDWAVTVHGERYSLICGTPADSIVQAFRPVLGVMLVIAALWPLIRSLFYSAIPVFKVNPS